VAKQKKPNIRYTNREFDSIKADLVSFAKRYYPTTFKDFNDASFGALMLDTVAYIGDVLSFYLDYQANEQFLGTAVEYENVIRLAHRHGYRWAKVPTSTGICTFYCLIPAAGKGGPDEAYAPTLKKGSTVMGSNGSTYMLVEDVNFANTGLTTVVAKVDAVTGIPLWFARKGYGKVISGAEKVKSFTMGEFTRFKKVDLLSEDVAEVLSVVDGDGHEYYEVDFLTQDVVYKPVINNMSATRKAAPFIMKAIPAPRRFTVERTRGTTFLRFGFGSEEELASDSIADPQSIALEVYGKTYVSDTSFDPYKLLNSDKMGVSPTNTTLTVTYRMNDPTLLNAGAGTVTTVGTRYVTFQNTGAGVLSADKKGQIRASIEVTNDEAIVGDVSEPDADEIKLRAISMYAAQNRAVTREDYIALVYSMDKRFGAIKRCNIVKDLDSFKNNLNLYVVSEDENGLLTKSNDQIKRNVKTWLNRYKMINDSIDILDARIVNLGIEFELLCSPNFNKYDVLRGALADLQSKVSEQHFNIGESIRLTDLIQVLSGARGVSDVLSFRLTNITSAGYEATPFNVDLYRSPDGKLLIPPEDVIFEFRYPSLDIRGGTK